MEYDLDLEAAIKHIKEENAKKVCIQLPDGLKPKSGIIAKELEEKTNAKIIIWAGSCFGACDTPNIPENLGVDLVIQWGHKKFEKK